ncbi:MAG: 50S ribosomal protein L21e [Candidatus Nanohaloarchaeota archaeon]|nr:50S ribosomal protein L21e [Candidatus Nanohaloarchaeota archaeon]
MKRSHGPRSDTRHKYKAYKKLKITEILQEFKIGERVAIVTNPSYHRGMPFRRFHGKVGEIVGKRGRSYLVRFKDGGKEKVQIISPAHLKSLTQ